MAEVLKLRWEGITPDQYEAMRSTVAWESDIPKGLISHVAWFRDGGITIVDVWESSADFEAFMAERLTPGIEKNGLQGEPQITWFDAHAYHIPGVTVATSA